MRLKFAARRTIERMAARNKKMEFPLTDLPNELIALVVDSIDDVATLRRLARTSRRLQELTERVLWRRILVSNSSRARLILAAMSSRNERSLAVQSLNAPCDDHFGRDMSLLASILQKGKNLKEVTIESPMCNKIVFESEQVWSPMMDQLCLPFQRAAGRLATERPLQKLSKLTLHWNGPGSPYWTPDHRSLSIFLSPTLQYLKVSCVNLPEDTFDEVSEHHFTPLRALLLEECNISPRGLHGLLALPKALETLRLGENVYNQRHFDNLIGNSFNHLFHLSARTTIKALRQQKHSLRTLEYAAARFLVIAAFSKHVPRPKEPGLDCGFADFDSLEEIALVGPCAAFERAVMSSSPPPHLRLLSYQSDNPLTPPRGLHEHFEGDTTAQDNYIVSLLPFFRAPSAGVPNPLRKLAIIYQRDHMARIAFTEETKDAIRDTALALKRKHGAALTVSYMEFSSYYPPLLHGEPQPEKFSVYNGLTDEFGAELGVYDSSESIWGSSN